MGINCSNLFQHVIPMENFRLKWRFTNERYHKLPDEHLDQLKPLDDEAAKFLCNYIVHSGLHSNEPFKKGFFHTVDEISVSDTNEKEIKTWLYHRRLPLDKLVFLSWDETDAMIVPWKLLIQYFNSFYYGSSDDLTVMDQSLQWALLFHHEDNIYFGTKKNFKPGEAGVDGDFTG